MEQQRDTDLFELLLAAREARQQRKMELVAKGFHLISLQLNIPGLPKSNASLKEFIAIVDEAFKRFLLSHNANNQYSKKLQLSDEAGDTIYYLFQASHFDAWQLKELTEQFEESFSLGRIVDLDVLSNEGVPLSSGKAKACFICEQSALHCRQNKRHAIEEVRLAMIEAITDFMLKHKQDKMLNDVAGFAVKGLLHEVALSPKPGLVCRNSMGAHSDMDYLTFINAIASLSPYFMEINRYALSYNAKDVSAALPVIKNIGMQMELAMFETTNGVNTHKGAIFLMAISCFAMVRVIKRLGYLKITAFSSVIQQLTRGLVQRELCAAGKGAELSHGQQCFALYGLQAAGARGEAEQGLPTVLHHSLPALNHIINKDFNSYTDKDLNHLLTPVLLRIMTINNDTNVLYRHDKTVLEQLKSKSLQALEEWEKGCKNSYEQLVKWCNSNRISPGGSADLLAVTIALHCCQTEYIRH
ncbi:MAG: triphosphoribosyl-dephospho-CoA synthase [Carboxylicivirga sp.]|jgi:holo-ACP synthase/triphosphoribosyl-dephospho-CoA synthase|nr:triphosphoribosyl-dephospho-CoA synthase [Carboxylicivirga sp.]